MTPRASSWATLALFAACATACEPRRSEPVSETNLILITLDTTRADRLGCYGYAAARTPSLDRLASLGTRFDHAVAHTPLTLPSHATLFTGRYPLGHGIRDNAGFKLQDELSTLAELLHAQGYRTAAFVAAKVLLDKFGIAQGFEEFDQEIPLAEVERNAEAVVDAALVWLGAHGRERFFVWLHLYDPHVTYAPPEPFASLQADPYDGEIAYMDSQIGRLLTYLESQGLFETTAIVAVGDHGESLGEHDEPAHGYFTYDATLRVPFIVKPGGAERSRAVVEPQVRLVDVMPTALSLLGYRAPEGIDGFDLTPLLREELEPIELSSYAESYEPYYKYGFSPIRALRTSRYKLIESPGRELYDLVQDPGETRNLIAEQAAIASELEQELARILEASSTGLDASMPIDEETRDALSALGYLGGHVTAPLAPDSDLPDARDHYRYHLALAEIKRDIDRVDPDLVQPRLDQVLAAHPQMAVALELQSTIFFRKKAYAESAEILERLLEAEPTNTRLLQKLAMSRAAEGNGPAARTALELVVSLAPGDAEARQNLWKLYHGLGQDALAVADIERLIEQDPALGYPWLWLARFRASGRDPETVEAAYQRAARDPQSSYEAYLELGRFYSQRRQPAQAIEALERAVTASAMPLEARLQLAGLYYVAGDKLAARRQLEQARELAPDHAEVRSRLAQLDRELEP